MPGNLVFDIAVKGAVYISEAITKVMKDGGCIINISSTSPFMVPAGYLREDLFPLAKDDFDTFLKEIHAVIENQKDEQSSRNFAYMCGRSFMMWYSEYYACKVGRDCIRVIAVGPGVVDGPMVDDSGLALANMCSLGRTGRPDEMAEIYAFLLSDKASYITGTNIMADGGIVAALHNKE